MNGVSQPHGRATISTGGAAKWVSVPPIDTFTNSSPSVAYAQPLGRLEVVELPRQQQRADRHRRRLGDERAEQRADDQDRRPTTPRACRRRRSATRRSAASANRDDRPRRRQRHDDDDEQRFGVVDGVVEVVTGRRSQPRRPSWRPPAARPTGRTRLRPRRGSAAVLGRGRVPLRRRAAGADALAMPTPAANVCRMASRKMPVATRLNGSRPRSARAACRASPIYSSNASTRCAWTMSSHGDHAKTVKRPSCEATSATASR